LTHPVRQVWPANPRWQIDWAIREPTALLKLGRVDFGLVGLFELVTDSGIV
jgi:hypothetical protein